MVVVEPGHHEAPVEIDDARVLADVTRDALVRADVDDPVAQRGHGLAARHILVHGPDDTVTQHEIGLLRERRKHSQQQENGRQSADDIHGSCPVKKFRNGCGLHHNPAGRSIGRRPDFH
ncbi:MAG: hypothetical protein U5K76_03805 [Woeseiaceae bacterium]|nr:hypothetical protein [Woeseiaceae bacterium]